jgi:hypothetical protein
MLISFRYFFGVVVFVRKSVEFRVFWDILPCSQMSTDVSEVRAASIIALMMEAARTSETSVNIYLTTRQYIPEDSELHTRRRENLKSHKKKCVCRPDLGRVLLN